MLGEFEYLLLTAAANLGDDAYGAAIRDTNRIHAPDAPALSAPSTPPSTAWKPRAC
jgi:hypothetical protein